MLLDKKQFLFNKLADQLIVNHLEKKIKMDVVEPDKIGSKFKNALQKEGALKELKSADCIIRFVEKIEAAPAPQEEKPAEDSQNQETPADGEKAEQSTETTEEPKQGEPKEEPKDGEETDTDSEDDKKKKEEVNESIKVQDLTKGMLSIPKASKPKTSTPKTSKSTSSKCSSCKKCSEAKSEKKDAEKKSSCCKKQLKEAETEATGDDLKVRVQKAVAKVFDVNKDEIDLVDVPNCIEGSNVYYCKLTFKDHESQTEEPGTEENK